MIQAPAFLCILSVFHFSHWSSWQRKTFFFDILRIFFAKKEGFCFYFIKIYAIFYTYFTNILTYYAK